MQTIIPGAVVECPNMDVEMIYLENNNAAEAIRQKLRKKDVYET